MRMAAGIMLTGALAGGCVEDAGGPADVEDAARTYSEGRATLTVPAGAAPSDFVPTIEPVAEAPAWAERVLPGTLHRFGPHGTQFDAPVALSFTYDPASLGDVAPENLRVVWLDEAGSRLEVMGAVVDAATHTVRGTTTHFSMFAAAPECAADADCAAGEVCRAGGCEADEAPCVEDEDGVCPPACEPDAEIADGIDNDCDGAVDEDGAPACAANADCAAGERCVDGVCRPDAPPVGCGEDAACAAGEICLDGVCVADEVDCDGIDNDGDGIVDEGCGVADGDNDDVPDAEDNCPAVPNPDQADTDGDGQGDACDPDVGVEICGDGIDNDADGRVDEDCDGLACAADADCPAGQACVDGRCDAVAPGRDGDNDGVDDADDNCPAVANPDQADADGDGRGDACDAPEPEPEACNGLDDDLDGVVDEGCGAFACADDADCARGEACFDGVCRALPAGDDADGDGVEDAVDNCPAVFNPDQSDADGDGLGDVCDAAGGGEICGNGIDDDGDGRVDEGCDGRACGADADCAAGEVCFAGMCVAE